VDHGSQAHATGFEPQPTVEATYTIPCPRNSKSGFLKQRQIVLLKPLKACKGHLKLRDSFRTEVTF
jgi:hypothetical protein